MSTTDKTSPNNVETTGDGQTGPEVGIEMPPGALDEYLSALVVDFVPPPTPEEVDARVRAEIDALASALAEPLPAAPAEPPADLAAIIARVPTYAILRPDDGPRLALLGVELLNPTNYVVRLRGKRFAQVRGEDLAVLRLSPDAHEVIDGGQPVRIALDIDGPLETLPTPAARVTALREILHALAWRLQTVYDIPWDDAKTRLAVATSTSSEKLSLHIVYAGEPLADARELKHFTRQLVERLGADAAECVDTSVPKSLFNLRLLGSDKLDTRGRPCGRPKLPHPWSVAMGLADWRDYLVQPKCDPTEPLPRMCDEKAPEASAPGMEDEEVARVMASLHDHCPEFAFRDVKGAYINLNRLASSHCKQCNRWHDHDHTLYLKKQDDGSWWANCRRGEASGAKGKGWLVLAAPAAKKGAAAKPKRTDPLDSLPPKPKKSLAERLRVAPEPFRSTELVDSLEMPAYELTKHSERLTLVRGNCGIGKTVTLKGELDPLNFPGTVLYIAPQVSLTRAAHALLGPYGFELYSDISGTICTASHPRVISTPESLWRTARTDYELVVLEEVCQLLAVFRSPTMAMAQKCHERFRGLMSCAPQIIALDAVMSNRTTAFLGKYTNEAPTEIRIIHNTRVRQPRRAEVTNVRARWFAALLADLKAGKRLAICSTQSADTAVALHTFLSKAGYRGKAYTKHMDVNERQAAFADLDAELERLALQYVIITPVVTSGVSIVRTEFDAAYANFQTFSDVPPGVAFQMLHRVRRLKDDRVTILTDLRQQAYPATRAEVLEHYSRTHALAGMDDAFGAHVLGITQPDGTTMFESSPSLELHLYLAAEEGRGRNDFIGCLSSLLQGAGYSVEEMAAAAPLAELEGKRAGKAVGLERKTIKATAAERVAAAATLTANELGDIQQALDADANVSAADRASLERSRLATLYELPPEAVTPAFVLKHGTPIACDQQRARLLARMPPDELEAEHRKMVERPHARDATRDTASGKVIILEHILRGIGFAGGLWTPGAVERADLDAAIGVYAPEFKAKERDIYRALGKQFRAHDGYDLSFFVRFLGPPLLDAYGAKLGTAYARASKVLQISRVTIAIPAVT